MNIELNKYESWNWPPLVEGTFAIKKIEVIFNELAPYIGVIDPPGTPGGVKPIGLVCSALSGCDKIH